MIFLKGILPLFILLFSSASIAASVPGEFIVRFKTNIAKDKFLRSKLFTTAKEIKNKLMPLVKVKSFDKALIKHLKSNPDIITIEPNFIYTIPEAPARPGPVKFDKELVSGPADPYFQFQWGLDNGQSVSAAASDISALEAWKITKGDRNIKVAVIDTGVNYNHADLKENIWTNTAEYNGKAGVDDDGNGHIDDIHGVNVYADSGDPMDDNDHGTHCAGTIAAKHNNIGIRGVMDDVSLVPIKFMDEKGRGSLENSIKAIDYAVSLGVDVMSNSWGGVDYSELLKEAVARAADKGIFFIAAAGNSHTNIDKRKVYPASFDLPNIISVAASTATDDMASFSNYGSETVLIAAPGDKIYSTAINGFKVFSGTSMAAPFVSGSVGLLLSHEALRPSFAELKERLIQTSSPIRRLKKLVKADGRLNLHHFLLNKRQARGPVESDWKIYKLDEAFQTEHPYGDMLWKTRTFKVPGASYIRIVIKKLDLEDGFDKLQIRIPATTIQRETIQLLTGQHENVISEYLEGDSIEVAFSSDGSNAGWGFSIEELQYVPATN